MFASSCKNICLTQFQSFQEPENRRKIEEDICSSSNSAPCRAAGYCTVTKRKAGQQSTLRKPHNRPAGGAAKPLARPEVERERVAGRGSSSQEQLYERVSGDESELGGAAVQSDRGSEKRLQVRKTRRRRRKINKGEINLAECWDLGAGGALEATHFFISLYFRQSFFSGKSSIKTMFTFMFSPSEI